MRISSVAEEMAKRVFGQEEGRSNETTADSEFRYCGCLRLGV